MDNATVSGNSLMPVVLLALHERTGDTSIRRPPKGLIHHSDRGSQYAAGDYQALLQRHKLVASMSRKGDCWDNAVMERFFGTLKSEWLDRQRYTNREQAKHDVIHFIKRSTTAIATIQHLVTKRQGKWNGPLLLESVSVFT